MSDSDLARTATVAIVGRPNVGKSALFNRLVGRNIAIVHDQPGVTRDRLAGTCRLGPRPFTIWDTGGIGGAGETALIKEVRAAADAAMRDSDAIVFVVDAQSGLTPIDQELARVLRKARIPVLLAVNKIDHEKHENFAAEFARLGFDAPVSISAAHGRGIGELLERVAALLPPAADSSEGENAESASRENAPPALAIVGKPNVGKSSLINAITHDTRSIVSEIAGTTRDAVDIAHERDGQRWLLIDTAGMRARGKHSSSVEVFSVMRSERTIRRASLCVLVIDVTGGVTTQDKKIAGLIQKANKPSVVLLNKWDLVKPERQAKAAMAELRTQTRAQLFFLDYAPVLIASARTGENVEQLFALINEVRAAARERIGTGVLNRLLHAAFETTPPPLTANRRLKLLYATQSGHDDGATISPPEFILFVNDAKLLTQSYERYLEGRIRAAMPYPGLPVKLTLRSRTVDPRRD